jgi:hypothetical protein
MTPGNEDRDREGAQRDLDDLRRQMQPGMKVYGDDGGELGTVKEVYTDHLRVDRRLMPDIDVPVANVAAVRDHGVVLRVAGADADVLVDPGTPQAKPPVV